MVTAMIIIFVIGYILITLEHPLHINKATFALLTCGVLWTVYAMMGNDPHIHEAIVNQLGDACEIVVFLIGAMTIVEIIDRYGGFSFITENINAKSKRHLLWIMCSLSFIMSAVLDNMTTTIIMVMMLRRLLSDQKERWLFAGLIVIAANAGGAFSPIGDVTTIMLWMDEKVTSVGLIVNLLIPSIIAMVVPVFIAQFFIKEGKMQTVTKMADKNPDLHDRHPHLSKAMLIIGVSGLLFVPLFTSVFSDQYYMEHPWVAKVWGMVAVSIAAQLGVAPLIAYYFGQFSTCFLLTNFLVVPAAFIILCLSIAVLLFPPLAYLLLYIVNGLNASLNTIATFPGVSIGNLHPTILQVVLIYVLIVCCYLLIERIKPIMGWTPWR